MLLLGPIVGHTTSSSVRIWIRGRRPASEYQLRISGVGNFQFAPTGTNAAAYGTAMAFVQGLRANRRYHYRVVHRGRVLDRGRGQFRTMPPFGSWLPQMVLFASCNDNVAIEAWDELARLVHDLEPHALFLIGDQVYQDEERPGSTTGIWKEYLGGEYKNSEQLCRRLADTYQQSWSRGPIADVLRSCTTYMMWDDHDIRDGWGSWASDSPTVANRNSKARQLCSVDEAYFQAARDVAWHFQFCRNPLTYPRAGINGGDSSATSMPYAGAFNASRTSFGFVLEWGRVAYILTDSRGDRDLWRARFKVLGEEQWNCLERYVASISADVDAVIFVTTVPIVGLDPGGLTQSIFQGRQEDVQLVEAGDAKALRNLQLMPSGGLAYVPAAAANVAPLYGFPLPGAPVHARNLGARATDLRHSDLDDARDQWSNEHSRPEQERLIRLAVRARTSNRLGPIPRSVMFVGGDLHTGARFTINAEGHEIPCMISSSISKGNPTWQVPFVLDETVKVADDIHATRHEVINIPHFGLVAIDLGVRPAQLSMTHIYKAGRQASAARLGGYLVTGNPIPEFVQRKRQWL